MWKPCSGAPISAVRCSRDVNLTNARSPHAWLVNVDIDAMVDSVVINGVDVTDYVNERDPWYPLRGCSSSTPEDMREAWAALEAEWAKTPAGARSRRGQVPRVGQRRVVLRPDDCHLVFAMDKWFTVPILGGRSTPSVCRIPARWISRGPASTTPRAVAHRSPRGTGRPHPAAVTTSTTVAPADLDRVVDVLENGPHPVRECIYTVFEESSGTTATHGATSLSSKRSDGVNGAARLRLQLLREPVEDDLGAMRRCTGEPERDARVPRREPVELTSLPAGAAMNSSSAWLIGQRRSSSEWMSSIGTSMSRTCEIGDNACTRRGRRGATGRARCGTMCRCPCSTPRRACC